MEGKDLNSKQLPPCPGQSTLSNILKQKNRSDPFFVIVICSGDREFGLKKGGAYGNYVINGMTQKRRKLIC
jgi:hypothetical protein